MSEKGFFLSLRHGLCLSKVVVFFNGSWLYLGCHERSSHTEWRFIFAKSLENKAAAEGKGDIGGFYVMTFPIPICISMHWNGLNKTNTTTPAAKTNHHRASRKFLSIITRWGHEWGMNSSERSSYTWPINIWQFKSYMAVQTKLQIKEAPLKSCFRAGIIHHPSSFIIRQSIRLLEEANWRSYSEILFPGWHHCGSIAVH